MTQREEENQTMDMELTCRPVSRRSFATGAAALAIATVWSVSRNVAVASAAQETPVSSTEPTRRTHPANIHQGTCDALGPVVFPLGAVGIVPSDLGEIANPGGEIVGPPDAIPALQSINELAIRLDALLAGPHVIAVEDAEGGGTLVACGNIGGTTFGDSLMFGLTEVNGSGYTGVGLLSRAGEANTNVVVYLARNVTGGTGEEAATATP